MCYSDMKTYRGWGIMQSIATEHKLANLKPKVFVVSHVMPFMQNASATNLELMKRVTDSMAGDRSMP